VVVVLVVASGAGWEAAALRLLTDHPRVVVLKRCVDVDDLMAAASAGQADVAVLGLDSPGLDLAATDHLRHHQVRPVAVVPAGVDADAARLRASRIGVAALVPEDALDTLPEAVIAADAEPGAEPPLPAAPAEQADGADGAVADLSEGRVIVVWGPAGAPGRTTVAAAIAAELARRRLRTALVDADPYGGAVAQQLGIMDEVSGLLAAARLAASGELADRFAGVQRGIHPHLGVVTGLPRPDRWVEVRAGAVQHVLEVARLHGHVVVDTGFSLEEDPGSDFGSRPGRNQMTLGALEVADEVVVVGNADPVGLARLARGLVELRDHTDATATRVVVNRMRPTLGWSEKDVAGMVAGFTRLAGLHFLPEDRDTVDRMLVAGRTLPEAGDSALGRAVAAVVEALVPTAPDAAPRRRRRPALRRPRH
jgi:MinD-like ATPase involved in chromosome partitioning or flagellar assembly